MKNSIWDEIEFTSRAEMLFLESKLHKKEWKIVLAYELIGKIKSYFFRFVIVGGEKWKAQLIPQYIFS